MNNHRKYKSMLCTLLLAIAGVVSGWAQTSGTVKVVRKDKSTQLSTVTFTGLPKGTSASISGTDFDHYLYANYHYGYCVTGNTFTVTFTNFKYEVTSVGTRCDTGVGGEGNGDYISTPLSGDAITNNIHPEAQLSSSYYSFTVAENLVGLASVQYVQKAGSSGNGNGRWFFFGSGSDGFIQVNYVYPTISPDDRTIHKNDSYTLTNDDFNWTHQGAFAIGDITLSSNSDCVTIDGKTISAVSEGTATITATLTNNGSDVTSNTFTVTVDKYALTSDSKNVHVYGSTITDDDIAGAHTFLGSADNVNALVYVEGGSYNGSKNNVVVKNGDTYSCKDLKLTDSQTASLSVPIAFTASKVTYERPSSTGKWNTIYLPYAPIKKDGYTYYVLSAADLAAGKLTFTEVSGDDLAANTPYLIKNTTSANINESSDESKSISVTTGTSGDATTLDGWSMNGVYKRTTFFKDNTQSNYGKTDNTEVIDANSYYIKADGSGFVVNKDYFNLSAFRGYFSAGTSVSTGAKASFLTFSTEDATATNINMIEKNDGTVDMIFDLSGRKLNNPQKGSVNIINGKKILVK